VKRARIMIATVPALLLLAISTTGCDSGSTSPTAPALPSAPVPPVTALSPTTFDAMELAIDDEHLARATYDAVIARFGPIMPFVNIRNAEDSHARALATLFTNYGLAVPVDHRAGTVTSPSTVAEACQLGVEAELANIAMYDQLLESTPEPDVLQVFSSNRAASLDNHLPAFRLCS